MRAGTFENKNFKEERKMSHEERKEKLDPIRKEIEKIRNDCPQCAELLDVLFKEAEDCPINEFYEKIRILKFLIQLAKYAIEHMNTFLKDMKTYIQQNKKTIVAKPKHSAQKQQPQTPKRGNGRSR